VVSQSHPHLSQGKDGNLSVCLILASLPGRDDLSSTIPLLLLLLFSSSSLELNSCASILVTSRTIGPLDFFSFGLKLFANYEYKIEAPLSKIAVRFISQVRWAPPRQSGLTNNTTTTTTKAPTADFAVVTRFSNFLQESLRLLTQRWIIKARPIYPLIMIHINEAVTKTSWFCQWHIIVMQSVPAKSKYSHQVAVLFKWI